MYNLFKKYFTKREYLYVDLDNDTLSGIVYGFADKETLWKQHHWLEKVITKDTVWVEEDGIQDIYGNIKCRLIYDRENKRIELKTTHEANFLLHYKYIGALAIASTFMYLVDNLHPIVLIIITTIFAINMALNCLELNEFNSELKRELSIRINHKRGVW